MKEEEKDLNFNFEILSFVENLIKVVDFWFIN